MKFCLIPLDTCYAGTSKMLIDCFEKDYINNVYACSKSGFYVNSWIHE